MKRFLIFTLFVLAATLVRAQAVDASENSARKIGVEVNAIDRMKPVAGNSSNLKRQDERQVEATGMNDDRMKPVSTNQQNTLTQEERSKAPRVNQGNDSKNAPSTGVKP